MFFLRTPNICKCGHHENNHSVSAKSNQDNEEIWDPNVDTITVPTNAFGNINFESHGTSQEGQVEHSVVFQSKTYIFSLLHIMNF